MQPTIALRPFAKSTTRHASMEIAQNPSLAIAKWDGLDLFVKSVCPYLAV